ncbi:DUF2231 domain-containing protein [Aeromicrobium camelliae]|uniref:DUF2231 domain-containing protein n=1 Tax=Aeromicrobium camelliae TaxID=1538144 RepID=UPI0026C48F83
MTHHARVPRLVRWTQKLEEDAGLDPYVARLGAVADRLIASPTRRELLHGTRIGHGIHPLMTDLPLGMWTSAIVLDLLGGRPARPAARRLIGLGILAAVPTATTGVAEWAVTGKREQRVGIVHAAANSASLTCFAGSFLARRRGHHTRGVLYALAGGLAAGVGGYLGGHLTEVRKVSTWHPAFGDEDPAQQ